MEHKFVKMEVILLLLWENIMKQSLSGCGSEENLCVHRLRV